MERVRKGRGRQSEDVCVGAWKNKTRDYISESLILAQNERWQRGLGMQVGRDPVDSNIDW